MGRTAILLACSDVLGSRAVVGSCRRSTYVFDIRARRDGDHVTVLDPEVLADNAVDPSAPIVELLVSEDDQNGILPLLSTDEDGVATEELEGLHGGLGEGNDRVVIVSGIGDPVEDIG